MGKMLIIVDEALELQFRETVIRRFIRGRGIISKAAEEAIRDWIKKQKKVNK